MSSAISSSPRLAASRQAEVATGRATIEVRGAGAGWVTGVAGACALGRVPPSHLAPRAKPAPSSPTATVRIRVTSSQAGRLRRGSATRRPAGASLRVWVTRWRMLGRAGRARTATQVAAGFGRTPPQQPGRPRRSSAARRRCGRALPGAAETPPPRIVASPAVSAWMLPHAPRPLPVIPRADRSGQRPGCHRWSRRRSAPRPGRVGRPARRPAGTAPASEPRSAPKHRWPADRGH